MEENPMEYSLARNWWLLALRGVLAMIFGVLVFLWPVGGWIVMVASFAAYALVGGSFAIAAALTGDGGGRRWWALLIEGLLGIAAGVLTLVWPGLTQLALLAFIAAWAIATGIFSVVAAIRLRKEIQGEWLLALNGILSVAFGVLLVLWPAEGLLAVAWLVAAYAFADGVLSLALAFRLRGLARHAPTPMRTAV